MTTTEAELTVHITLDEALAQIDSRAIWDFLGTDRESLSDLADFIADLDLTWRLDELNKHLKFYDLEVKHV